jgi:hypothetical protein
MPRCEARIVLAERPFLAQLDTAHMGEPAYQTPKSSENSCYMLIQIIQSKGQLLTSGARLSPIYTPCKPPDRVNRIIR